MSLSTMAREPLTAPTPTLPDTRNGEQRIRIYRCRASSLTSRLNWRTSTTRLCLLKSRPGSKIRRACPRVRLVRYHSSVSQLTFPCRSLLSIFSYRSLPRHRIMSIPTVDHPLTYHRNSHEPRQYSRLSDSGHNRQNSCVRRTIPNIHQSPSSQSVSSLARSRCALRADALNTSRHA